MTVSVSGLKFLTGRWYTSEEYDEIMSRRCTSKRTPGSKRSARCEFDKHEDGSHLGRSPGGYWFSWHD